MSARIRHRGAFTLIELLVVISILAMLVAMLIPFLQRARDIAKRAICSANMRTLGQGGQGFAAAHGGRGPGAGLLVNGAWSSSVSWADILNAEFYKSGTVQRIGFKAVKGMLYCPSISYNSWVGLYPRAHQWNRDFTGGPDWDPNYAPDYSPYGKPVKVSQVNYMYQPYSFGWYRLGALVEKFAHPGWVVLVREAEWGSDDCASIWPSVPTVTLNADTSIPPWCALGAQYGFRHLLPRDVTLYQAQATACYAFMDGHVEIMKPTMNVNSVDRYAIDQ